MGSWWRKLCIGSFGKVPESKSYEQVSLVKLTLPWLRFKWGPTINVCGGGGGYVAGKTKRTGDWGKEEHIRVHLNIERQQFSQPTKEMGNARPRGLRIWYTNNLIYFFNLYFIKRNNRIWTGNVHVIIVISSANKDDMRIFIPTWTWYQFLSEHGDIATPTIYLDYLKYKKKVLNSVLVLLSYALGAEGIWPHHRAGYPKNEGNDKQHTT